MRPLPGTPFLRRVARGIALCCLVTVASTASAAAPSAFTGGAAAEPFSFAATAQSVAQASAVRSLPSGFTDTIQWSGLIVPTTIRWAPDGRVFVAQKNGVIKVFDNLADPTATTYADLRSRVLDFGDRGLLGLAVDPQFTSGRPYLY